MFILLLSTRPPREIERRRSSAVGRTAGPRIPVRMRRLVIWALARLFRALRVDHRR